MLNLLQQHTITIYDLEQHSFVKKRMNARELLSADRFDLYAKLFYIKNRVPDTAMARHVYAEHILAFNPDGKEPGRSDKDGVDDFAQVFDELIDYFETHEFDENISLIPVDENHVPLDGSHRVAALAYYNKEVEVLYFPDVKSKTTFDYNYFINRGLSIKTADAIAIEILAYTSNLHLACIWSPKSNIDDNKDALNYIKNKHAVYYLKSMHMSLECFNRLLIFKIEHKSSDDLLKNLSSNIKTNNGIVQVILFEANNTEEISNIKKAIEEYYKLKEHRLYITDTHQETETMMNLVFTEKSKEFQSVMNKTFDKIEIYKRNFKNVYWLNLKVKVAKLLKQLK